MNPILLHIVSIAKSNKIESTTVIATEIATGSATESTSTFGIVTDPENNSKKLVCTDSYTPCSQLLAFAYG